MKTSSKKTLSNDSPVLKVLEVDESDPEDELDKPGTTIGTKFSVLQGIRIPFWMRCGFWPLIHSYEYPFSSQSFPNDNTAGVFFEDFHSQENISNSLISTVASSCVCTCPLSVMTIVGLHDFVKVSISASLKSFFADHMHRRSGVHNKLSFLKLETWCIEALMFRRWEECCSFLLL